jgi:recombinational DNA repair protein RecR
MKYPTTEAGWWQSEFETTCELLRAERKKIARLTAVADAARALLRECAQCDEFADDDEPMFSHQDIRKRFGAALKALEGEQRG